VVAVKTIVLPANMSGAEKREKMAIMEAAISSALSHPNIMQVRAGEGERGALHSLPPWFVCTCHSLPQHAL
jgi:hypothetical protein